MECVGERNIGKRESGQEDTCKWDRRNRDNKIRHNGNYQNHRTEKVILSKRLQMLADMVTPDSRVADVGCDHGFLSIYLVQAKIASRVIAMDVREGPLQAAREHVKAYGLDPYIETRLSDGMGSCQEGEVDTMVCAGMGGRLMERILRQDMEQMRRLGELVLQPQSELEEFRIFLREAGFVTDREDMVEEGGKYYPAMRVSWGGEGQTDGETGQKLPDPGVSCAAARKEMPIPRVLCDRFGEGLLRDRHPVLEQYLEWQKATLLELQGRLSREDSWKAKMRLEEILKERQVVEQALEYYT